MAYTEQHIKDEFQNFLDKIDKLYDKNIVKRKGKTGEKHFSEIIATEILNNISLFDDIKTITRESKGKSYRTESHHNGTIAIRKTNRMEENYAKDLYSKSIKIDDEIFKIIDFQIPLKDKQSDKLGKIDLMSFNENTSTLYLIELKFGDNVETLLRAILEAHTYYKIINKDKLKNDFKFNEIKNIKPAVMVVGSDCNSYKELEDIKNRPELLKLAKKLDITFFKSADEATFEIFSAENL